MSANQPPVTKYELTVKIRGNTHDAAKASERRDAGEQIADLVRWEADELTDTDRERVQG